MEFEMEIPKLRDFIVVHLTNIKIVWISNTLSQTMSLIMRSCIYLSLFSIALRENPDEWSFIKKRTLCRLWHYIYAYCEAQAEEQCIMLEGAIRLCRGTDTWDSPVLKPPCSPVKISRPYRIQSREGDILHFTMNDSSMFRTLKYSKYCVVLLEIAFMTPLTWPNKCLDHQMMVTGPTGKTVLLP